MRILAIGLGFMALIGASIASAAPREAGAARFTDEFSAQQQPQTRPRITIHPRATRPGPNSKRYCRAWLAQEYRISGTVIVPRMQCWWQ